MIRRRRSHHCLPRRVYLKNGAYRFLSAEPILNPWTGRFQRWIKLCSAAEGENTMLAQLTQLLGQKTLPEGAMPSVCQAFAARKLAHSSKDWQTITKQRLQKIALAFEDFQVNEVSAKDCTDFLRVNFIDHPNTLQKYKALLFQVFRFAVGELGLRVDNPMNQVDMRDYRPARRRVLPSHEEIKLIRAAARQGKQDRDTQSGEMFCAIIDMTYLLWQRGADMRMMRESQIRDGYIHFTPSKTEKTSGASVSILITPEIQAVIDQARAIKARRGIASDYLFPNRDGKPYTKSGLNSIWRRAKARHALTFEFTYRDIRALGATDARKNGAEMKDVQKRLAHTEEATSRIYIKEKVAEKSELKLTLPW